MQNKGKNQEFYTIYPHILLIATPIYTKKQNKKQLYNQYKYLKKTDKAILVNHGRKV